jgi:hypothetical protein
MPYYPKSNPTTMLPSSPTTTTSTKRARIETSTGTTEGYGSTSTVSFNVGGKRYEVSRSLIEQTPNGNNNTNTMLARMISPTWQSSSNVGVGNTATAAVQATATAPANNSNNAFFIDRDGERFGYVLDFLRYGQVSVPFHISKELLMLDMDYYGITSANDDNVKHGAVHYGQARVEELHQEKKRLRKKISKIEGKIETIDHEFHIMKVATKCFHCYMDMDRNTKQDSTGTSTNSTSERRYTLRGSDFEGTTHCYFAVILKAFKKGSADHALLQKCLEIYGLRTSGEKFLHRSISTPVPGVSFKMHATTTSSVPVVASSSSMKDNEQEQEPPTVTNSVVAHIRTATAAAAVAVISPISNSANTAAWDSDISPSAL